MTLTIFSNNKQFIIVREILLVVLTGPTFYVHWVKQLINKSVDYCQTFMYVVTQYLSSITTFIYLIKHVYIRTLSNFQQQDLWKLLLDWEPNKSGKILCSLKLRSWNVFCNCTSFVPKTIFSAWRCLHFNTLPLNFVFISRFRSKSSVIASSQEKENKLVTSGNIRS